MLEMNLEKESEPEELGRGSSPSRLFRMGDASSNKETGIPLLFLPCQIWLRAMACGSAPAGQGPGGALLIKGKCSWTETPVPRLDPFLFASVFLREGPFDVLMGAEPLCLYGMGKSFPSGAFDAMSGRARGRLLSDLRSGTSHVCMPGTAKMKRASGTGARIMRQHPGGREEARAME